MEDAAAITYAETRYKKPFDWNEFLNKPRRSEKQWHDAGDLAENWVTCACGNQCAALPRFENGSPVDERLMQYGQDFAVAIGKRQLVMARRILMEIEARTAVLLAELPCSSAPH